MTPWVSSSVSKEGKQFDRESQNVEQFMFDVFSELLFVDDVVGADVNMARSGSVSVWVLLAMTSMG